MEESENAVLALRSPPVVVCSCLDGGVLKVLCVPMGSTEGSTLNEKPSMVKASAGSSVACPANRIAMLSSGSKQRMGNLDMIYEWSCSIMMEKKPLKVH